MGVTPLEINLGDFEKWVRDTISLADSVENYSVPGIYSGCADLDQSLQYFGDRWRGAINTQSNDLQEYGPRLKMTAQAYFDTDEYIKQDLEKAWAGTY